MSADRTITLTTSRGITGQVRIWNGPSAGGGAPIVYLHGAAGLMADEPMLDALAARHAVFAPVWPGYGDEPGEEKIDDMLDFTLHGWDLVEALRREGALAARPHLIGHDMGAMIAAEMAAIAPNDLERLVVMSALGMWVDASPVPDIFMLLPFEFPDLLFADSALGTQLLTGGLDFEDPKAIETFQVNNSRRLGTAGKILFPIPDRRLSKRAYRITAPALIVWGAMDRFTPVDPYLRAWRDAIPHAASVVIDGTGHMVPLEQGAAAAQHISAFLA